MLKLWTILCRVPSEPVDAFETTLLPDNVVSNDERMSVTMKIIVYRQIKGKISVEAVSHLFACFLLQAFDSQRKLRNKNLKMF